MLVEKSRFDDRAGSSTGKGLEDGRELEKSAEKGVFLVKIYRVITRN